MTEPSSPRRIGQTSLVDLLDRVLDGGAVISGDVIIALAGIDLIRIDLRLMVAPVYRLLDEEAR